MGYLVRKDMSRHNFVEMTRLYGESFLYCRYGNDYIFIHGANPLIEKLKSKKRFEAVMCTQEKIPLYKVAMNAQMGKGFATTKNSRTRVELLVVECREKVLYKDVYVLEI